ncbi:MAG: S-layer homology domain-containing protein [Oscillibacter sp.]|nr:S-layer homology domain-containing protein [Oscillibacter sp.]
MVQVTAFAEDEDFSEESQVTDVNDIGYDDVDFEEEPPVQPECICDVFCTDEAVNYYCPVCVEDPSACMGEPAPEHEHFSEFVNVVDAKCMENGEKSFICNICGESITEIIPATGHTPVVIEGVAATETEMGLTDGFVCAVCDEVLVEQEAIPTLEPEAVVMTAEVQVFLAMVADLPEEIATNEQYDAVMAALPGISELYVALSEDEQELPEVLAALEKLESLQRQLGDGYPELVPGGDEQLTATQWLQEQLDNNSTVYLSDIPENLHNDYNEVFIIKSDAIEWSKNFGEDQGAIVIRANTNVTLDLNGYVLIWGTPSKKPDSLGGDYPEDNERNLFTIVSGGNLTITDSKNPTTQITNGTGNQSDNTDTYRASIKVQTGSNPNNTFCVQAGGTLTIEDGVYNGGGGRGAWVAGGTMNMTGGVITNCKATSVFGGGGVFVDGDGTFNMTGGWLSNCRAEETSVVQNGEKARDSYLKGGGVYVGNGTFNLGGGTTRASVRYGHATNGAGVYVASGAVFNMEKNGSITNCDADAGNNTIVGNGGGVYVAPGAKFFQHGGNVTNNGALYGSGVYTAGDYELSDGGVNNNNNSHCQAGGGVYIADGTCTVENEGKITSNTAQYGAGLYLKEGTVTLNRIGFNGNKASVDGGALYIAAGSVTINSRWDSIWQNKAGNNGGGIFVAQPATVTVNFIGSGEGIRCNEAQKGAGVYNEGTFIVNDENTHIWNNYATVAGDDVYSTGTLTLTTPSTIGIGERLNIGGKDASEHWCGVPSRDMHNTVDWFYDGMGDDTEHHRWDAHGIRTFTETTDGVTITNTAEVYAHTYTPVVEDRGIVALKAAHPACAYEVKYYLNGNEVEATDVADDVPTDKTDVKEDTLRFEVANTSSDSGRTFPMLAGADQKYSHVKTVVRYAEHKRADQPVDVTTGKNDPSSVDIKYDNATQGKYTIEVYYSEIIPLVLTVNDRTEKYNGAVQTGWTIPDGAKIVYQSDLREYVVVDAEGKVLDNLIVEVDVEADYDGTIPKDDSVTITNSNYTAPSGKDVTTYTNSTAGTPVLEENDESTVEHTLKVVAGNLTITPAELVVTANDQSKVYDGEPFDFGALIDGYTVDGLMEGDAAGNVIASVSYTGAAVGAVDVDKYAITPVVTKTSNPNYTIKTVDGTLTITPAQITIAMIDATKIYGENDPVFTYTAVDGQNQDVTAAVANIIDTKRADSDSSMENVGDNIATTAVIKSGSVDSKNVEITVVPGKLTIKPRPITITVTGVQKTVPYNGMEQTAEGFTVDSIFDEITKAASAHINDSNVVLTPGAKAEAKGTNVTGSPYVMDLTENSFALTGVNSKNFTVKFTVKEDGWLKITPLEITVVVKNATKEYGDPDPESFEYSASYTADGSEKDAKSIIENDTTLAREDGEDVGKYAITATVDETSGNFKVASNTPGTLAITPAPLTITTPDGEKYYDGTPLTTENGTIIGLKNGETATVKTTGSKDANVSATPYTNGYMIEWGTAKESNYEVTDVTLGELTILPVTLTITTKSGEKPYDGTALTNGDVEIEGLVTGEMLDVTATGSQLNAGSTENGYEIDWDKSTAKKGNYTVQPGTLGTLTVTRIPLTITTASAQKIHDGTPLTKQDEVEITGLVKGEEIMVNVTGSQTAIGSSPNTYSIDWGTTDESNYIVTDKLGTLTVIPYTDPFTPGPAPSIPSNPATPSTTIDDDEVPLANTVGLNDAEHFAYIIGYDDDTVRPLNNITRAEAVTIFFRLMTDEHRAANWSTENSFSDVNVGNWFNNAVSTVQKAGALEHFAQDDAFLPNQAITRAEFASIAAGFVSDEITGENVGDFKDTEGHWAAEAIRKAVEAGWITGVGGNRFDPDATITRAEVMTMINRMLDRTPDKDHMLPTMKLWTDNPESAWYYEAVQEATNEHDYERDEMSVETWTELLTVRDWQALETEWANNGGITVSKTDSAERWSSQVPDGI